MRNPITSLYPKHALPFHLSAFVHSFPLSLLNLPACLPSSMPLPLVAVPPGNQRYRLQIGGTTGWESGGHRRRQRSGDRARRSIKAHLPGWQPPHVGGAARDAVQRLHQS